MLNEIDNKKIDIQQAFTVSWLFFSILVFIFASLFHWNHYRLEKYEQMERIAQHHAFMFDDFIATLLQSTFALTFTDQQFQNCSRDLKPLLKQMVFNNPNLSGLAITNRETLAVCSTLPQTKPLLQLSIAPTLTGPLDLGTDMELVYLIHQSIGNYQYSLYIIESVIHKPLAHFGKLTRFDAVGIYDKTLQTLVFKSGIVESLNIIRLKQNIPVSTNHTIVIPSQTLNNNYFIFKLTPIRYDSSFIYFELLILVVVILLSILFYQVFSKLLAMRFSLQTALKNSLKHHHFAPIYQPILNVANNRVGGAEILVRWQLEPNRQVMPDLFIEEAEESGLIVPITLQLVEKSLQECKSILHQHPDFHLAINLSVNHFQDPHFFNQLQDICRQHHIQPRQIILELTERMLFDNQDVESIALMQQLRDDGFSLAIDDFGTGHASIQYLQHLPFNYLKIDKIFVQAIGTGAVTETLNQAIIHLAKSLHLAIIAEGVETAEQFAMLCQQQIDFIQGWYYAKPMTIDQLTAFIQEQGDGQ